MVSSRLVSQIDRRQLHQRALGDDAGYRPHFDQFPNRCRVPAGRVAGRGVPPESATILRIRNTLALEHVVASEACLSALADRADVEPLGSPTDWPLDAAGNFDESANLLSGVHAS